MKVIISKEAYKTKEEAKAAISSTERRYYKDDTGIRVKAVKWNEVNISPRDFYDLILKGYSWTTGLYKAKLLKEANNNSKHLIRKKTTNGTYRWMPPFDNGYINNGWIKEDWWSGSYCMFADIDNTRSNSIEDYCSKLPADFLPTFGFYSPNDKPNNRRFKLVWIFDFPILDLSLWKEIIKTIHTGLNKIEQLKDSCGTVSTQVSYGNQGGSGVWFGYTYDPSIFNHLLNNIKTDEEKEAEDNGKDPSSIQIDQNLIGILQRNFPLKNLKFIKYVNWIWRKEDEIDWVSRFPLASIGLCKEDYWELTYNFGEKIKDGNERRKKLFMRMCLRRLLKPDATPEEILLNAYRDREYIIDNTDGVVSVDNLVRNVKAAFSYELEELNNMFKVSIEKLKKMSPSIVFKYYKGRNFTRTDYNTIKGRFTQYLISNVYDENKSEKENIELFNKTMEEWGYKFRIADRKLLLEYRKENQITKNNERDLFILKKHKEGLSATQIIDELMDNGFKSMSKRQVNRIISKLNNTTTQTQNNTSADDNNDDWAKWLFPVSSK